jgi:hypothetical protein
VRLASVRGLGDDPTSVPGDLRQRVHSSSSCAHAS